VIGSAVCGKTRIEYKMLFIQEYNI
jgi:hypothetical protein